MLNGENRTLSWFDIIPEEDELDCSCDYCEYCYECDEDESLTITEIIDGYAELLEVPHCPECTKRILEMFYDEITELLED
jgi:hypothetical protein